MGGQRSARDLRGLRILSSLAVRHGGLRDQLEQQLQLLGAAADVGQLHLVLDERDEERGAEGHESQRINVHDLKISKRSFSLISQETFFLKSAVTPLDR